MVIDAGRIKHLGDLMHKSIASNGSAVSSNWRLSADGLTNVVWTPESASSVSYGSNSNEVSYANAAGASTLVSRTDHVHRGVTSLAHSSNTYTGPVTLETEGALYIVRSAANTYRFGSTTGSGGGGSGGLTQAYVGYNTAGGSQETMAAKKVYAKKVTLANACEVASIEAYLDAAAGNDFVNNLAVALYDDNAGAPGNIIQLGGFGDTNNLLMQTASGGSHTVARWIGVAIGKWLAAGDYWLAVSNMTSNASIGQRIYYDGSGTDRTYPSGGVWFTDWGFYGPTTTSNKYSIRANTIR